MNHFIFFYEYEENPNHLEWKVLCMHYGFISSMNYPKFNPTFWCQLQHLAEVTEVAAVTSKSSGHVQAVSQPSEVTCTQQPSCCLGRDTSSQKPLHFADTQSIGQP